MSDSRADVLRALLFASTAAGMLMSGPVMAEPGPDGDPQDVKTLESVTVDGHAVRRESQSPEFTAPLVDTPRSVTIIPQQIIEQTAATSLQDILRNSPGITFGAGDVGDAADPLGGDQNTGGAVGTELLDPEETESFEIGAKANLFGDRLTLSGAAFFLKRENAQIQVSPGVFEQAGEAEVRGVELGVSGNITREWQVFGGYTWMESELVAGAYNKVNVGDPPANTPEHSFSRFTTYRVIPGLSVGGGVYHVSDSFGGNQDGAGGGRNRVYAPAWTRVDLFASYDINERASLQLNVQNAGDEDYILRTNGVHHADVAPGRQAILTLNLRY